MERRDAGKFDTRNSKGIFLSCHGSLIFFSNSKLHILMSLSNDLEETSIFFRSEVSVQKWFQKLVDSCLLCSPRNKRVEDTIDDPFDSYIVPRDQVSKIQYKQKRKQ